ncbi:methyltransferase domain-containing protein [Luteimonas sp. FCS-9]|uniref:methyltransferase domain-containing protein n=1 Tax=Luteimonas sp. FCS-9 TaxID=1547516 RepID=UPI0009E57FF9|nr:methyltransferase domain-containing protein [Luteimonas sp. FCS-9]
MTQASNDQASEAMEFTGERFVPGVSGEIEMEHYHRYRLALALVAGREVLDIACGEGYGAHLLSERAASVVGVDVSPQAVEHARLAYCRENLRFEVGDCAAIPLPDASVDVVVSFETIEHHDQHDAMIEEVSRVLRPGGLLVISSPDRYEYSERPGYRNPFHVKELDRNELIELLHSKFAKVELYGQRTVMGSLVGPAARNLTGQEGASHFWVPQGGGGAGDVSEAALPREPVYFIALASNVDLPTLPVSVFEVSGYIESRIESIATDYQSEIVRIGRERDAMLRDKDDAWAKRVEQVAADYRQEIERIGRERDSMLQDKDARWSARLEHAKHSEEVALEERDRDWLLRLEGVLGRGADKAAWSVVSVSDQSWKHGGAPALATSGTGLEMASPRSAGDFDGLARRRDTMLKRCETLVASLPLVSLIVVNYNGLRYLPGLMASLSRLDYPRYEIVLVDNASSDESLNYLAQCCPGVRVIRAGSNLGFAGGNNLGMRSARGELIGLINNDTEVEPGWLTALVSALMRDERVWAVGSKIVFFRRYVEVLVRSPAFCPQELGLSRDTRRLGLLVSEASEFPEAGYRKPVFADGFWPGESIGGAKVRWTNGQGRFLLPIPTSVEQGATLCLELSATDAAAGVEFTVEVGGRVVGEGVAGNALESHEFAIGGEILASSAFDVINNAGTRLDESGNAGDRGIYEPDAGQYAHEEDVDALCGASMLMRRSVLERVGLFDSSFFMYYEDTDLCWRIRRAGGIMRYVPSSVVRHIHTGSSVEWSPTFLFYVSRNHILLRFKHAPLRVAFRSYFVELARFGLAVRGLISPGRGRHLARQELNLRLRLQVSLLKQIPRALFYRWTARPRPEDTMGHIDEDRDLQ